MRIRTVRKDIRERTYPEWTTRDGLGRGEVNDPEEVRDVCLERYSACGRAGVIGGGGAMSAFLSCGSEEWCGCLPKNSPSALRRSRLFGLLLWLLEVLFSSSSNSTSIRPRPS